VQGVGREVRLCQRLAGKIQEGERNFADFEGKVLSREESGCGESG
jgi:hypothetical protein